MTKKDFLTDLLEGETDRVSKKSRSKKTIKRGALSLKTFQQKYAEIIGNIYVPFNKMGDMSTLGIVEELLDHETIVKCMTYYLENYENYITLKYPMPSPTGFKIRINEILAEINKKPRRVTKPIRETEERKDEWDELIF